MKKLICLLVLAVFAIGLSPELAAAKGKPAKKTAERTISEAGEGAEAGEAAATEEQSASLAEDAQERHCPQGEHVCRVGGGCRGCAARYKCYPNRKKCPPLPR